MDQIKSRLGAVKLWMMALGITAALVAPVAVPRAFARSHDEADERKLDQGELH